MTFQNISGVRHTRKQTEFYALMVTLIERVYFVFDKAKTFYTVEIKFISPYEIQKNKLP